MKKIVALTVDHETQRYPTVGDYEEGHGLVVFSVSNMNNDHYEALVLIHELVEYLLVRARGIPLADIDAFDINYEKNRTEFDLEEPGDAINAPYRREHQFATRIEKLLAAELGVDWPTYDKTVSDL